MDTQNDRVRHVWLGVPTGVTGARSSMESRVEQLVSSLHAVTDKAVCVGFGVSGPSQVLHSKAANLTITLMPLPRQVGQCAVAG